MFKIVIDENISFAEEAFGNFGTVELMHGRKIDREILKDADALIIRSITNINESLLKNTPVKFVGTATIGTDHIDLNYLKENNIAFSSAKGCNADAVSEYVFTALFHLLVKKEISLKGKSLGVIGVGNIGSRVARLGKALGLEVLQNDPPLERQNQVRQFVSLNDALSADFITLHVPLNTGGEDNTYHLVNEENLSLIKKGAVLINASRGPVVENNALLKRLQSDPDLSVVLDVWEKEPGFEKELLKLVDIGTPHIAGYSLEGKVNGTVIIFDALARFLGETKKFSPQLPVVPDPVIHSGTNISVEEMLNDIFSNVYDIKKDDSQMRKSIQLASLEREKHFDLLRKDYSLRREFSNYKVRLEPFRQDTGDILEAFRFKPNRNH